MIKVYGAPGWGSAISELMLTLADIPYRFVDVSGFDREGPQRDQLQKINPLCQVPTLTLENGEVMTETALRTKRNDLQLCNQRCNSFF